MTIFRAGHSSWQMPSSPQPTLWGSGAGFCPLQTGNYLAPSHPPLHLDQPKGWNVRDRNDINTVMSFPGKHPDFMRQCSIITLYYHRVWGESTALPDAPCDIKVLTWKWCCYVTWHYFCHSPANLIRSIVGRCPCSIEKNPPVQCCCPTSDNFF